MEEKKEREGEAESLSPETPQTGGSGEGAGTDGRSGMEEKGRPGIALAAVIGAAVLGGGRGPVLLPGNGKV